MKVLQISAAGMIMTVTLHLHLWSCVWCCADFWVLSMQKGSDGT